MTSTEQQRSQRKRTARKVFTPSESDQYALLYYEGKDQQRDRQIFTNTVRNRWRSSAQKWRHCNDSICWWVITYESFLVWTNELAISIFRYPRRLSSSNEVRDLLEKYNGFGWLRNLPILCVENETFDDPDEESDGEDDIDDRSFDKQLTSTTSFIQRPRQGFQTRRLSLWRNVLIPHCFCHCLAAPRRRETLTTNRISSPINPRHICMFLITQTAVAFARLSLYSFSSCKNECTPYPLGSGTIVDSARPDVVWKSTRTDNKCLWSTTKIRRSIYCSFS